MASSSSSRTPPASGPAVNPEQMRSLRHQHEKMLSDNAERAQTYLQHRQDYADLRKRLDTLADRPHYPTMVPLGKKAFMAGQLVHTNEVLVLLGDNWFAEQSAKEAGEICARRLRQCEDRLEELVQERKLIESWRAQADRLAGEDGGLEEIREPYDEKAEAEWREQHKESVRKHRETVKKEHKTEEPVKSNEEDDEALWRRLDELELQEELDAYLEEEKVTKGQSKVDEKEGRQDSAENPWEYGEGEEDDSYEEQPLSDEEEEESESDEEERKPTEDEEHQIDLANQVRLKRRVSFAEVNAHKETEVTSREVESKSRPAAKTIEVVHSKPESDQSSAAPVDLLLSPELMTPADLLRMAGSGSGSGSGSGGPKPKSILKPFDTTGIRVRQGEEEESGPARRSAFTMAAEVAEATKAKLKEPASNPVQTKVVERTPMQPSSVVPPSASSERKPSRFKQGRNK